MAPLRVGAGILLVVALAALLVWAIAASITGHRGAVAFAATFETPRDTIGWRPDLGPGAFGLRAEQPPGGGDYALWVSGSCIVPHASHRIPASSSDRRFVLRALAKSVRGGTIVMATYDEEPTLRDAVFLGIDREEWHQYQSAETLFCAAGDVPSVEIWAGGLAEGGIFVERIEVVRIP